MKEFINKISTFCINRLAELVGIAIVALSIFLMISLISYSPEDPNFIFTDNTEIKNIMGSKGSLISDLLYQSFGLISFLLPFTFLFTGINIIRSKKFLILIENTFFSILYIIFGCLFFSAFYIDSYWLIINGNNGFIGNLFDKTFILSIVQSSAQISFYILILLISLIFLKSINFRISYIIKTIKKIPLLFKRKIVEKNNYIQNNFDETVEPEIQETRVQENFTFEKKSSTEAKQIKFKLPTLDFLKKPTKKERENSSEIKINEETLEKILLDFGVEGKINKISNGPVVTLNEFEPAPGVKVSKIINLSEDIARNTSSESARIATIPGSSSIGIELPKSSRENVYLSEIISSIDFSKKI